MHWLGLLKGGPGSGNFGHAGRPGEVGGSAPDDSPSGPADIPSADKAESSRDLVTLGKYDDWKDVSGKRKVTLFHYSREDRTDSGLKRKFAGTAGAGEERRAFEYDKDGKLIDETAPVHAYMYGAKRESMVPGNVLHKIEAELNVLDVASPKYHEILKEAQLEAERTGRPMIAMARALAKGEGYDALASSRDGIVQILRDVKPEELSVSGGAKKKASYTPLPSASSAFVLDMKRRWDVKLKNVSKGDADLELHSLKFVADKMVSMGALSKEDRQAILGNMVGSDLKSGLPAINAKIEELKSKIPSSVSEEDRKKIDDSFKYAITFGKTKEQLGKEMVEQAQKLLEEKPKVAIRAPLDAIDQIIEDGRFKNQFETGTTQGALNESLRKKVELEGQGVPEDTPGPERPVYGYMSRDDGDHDNASLQYYGGVAFILKDSVRERSTVTFDDSLDHELPSSSVKDVKIESMMISEGLIDEDTFKYVEAQIHGGLEIDDVEEAIIEKSALSKMLRAYNEAKRFDDEGEPVEFGGFVGGKLFSSGIKISVIDARDFTSAGQRPKKYPIEELFNQQWYKDSYKGTLAGDALESQIEVKREGKNGSDYRPSWW